MTDKPSDIVIRRTLPAPLRWLLSSALALGAISAPAIPAHAQQAGAPASPALYPAPPIQRVEVGVLRVQAPPDPGRATSKLRDDVASAMSNVGPSAATSRLSTFGTVAVVLPPVSVDVAGVGFTTLVVRRFTEAYVARSSGGLGVPGFTESGDEVTFTPAFGGFGRHLSYIVSSKRIDGLDYMPLAKDPGVEAGVPRSFEAQASGEVTNLVAEPVYGVVVDTGDHSGSTVLVYAFRWL